MNIQLLCRWAISHHLTILEDVHKSERTASLLFSFVPHLVDLSFYICVPDPDMSINKRGLPLLNQTQAMFMFGPVLGGTIWTTGSVSPPFSELRWNQDVPPA